MKGDPGFPFLRGPVPFPCVRASRRAVDDTHVRKEDSSQRVKPKRILNSKSPHKDRTMSQIRERKTRLKYLWFRRT